jgi:hypothetical protein
MAVPDLKVYSTLDEIKAKLNNDGKELVDDLMETFNDANQNDTLKVLLITEKIPVDIFSEIDAAWVHLALCKLFGIQYMDETHTQLQYPIISQLFTTMPLSTVTTIVDKYKVSTDREKVTQDYLESLEKFAMFLRTSVAALNKMVADGVVEKLELPHVLTSEQTGGAVTTQVTETPNYYAIANVIKHNNYMLLNYLTNADNVSGYTEEMHGGGAFDIKKFHFDHGNLVAQPPIVPGKGIVKKNDTIVGNLGSKQTAQIVDIINEQIEALKEKGKRLSPNSNNKVKKVVEDIIVKYNDVNELVAQLLAHNTYPSKGKQADIENDNEPYKRLEKALREKNRSELKGLAVSEGLQAALSDVVRALVTSTTSMPLGLTIV